MEARGEITARPLTPMKHCIRRRFAPGLLLLLPLAVAAQDYPIQPVPFTAVQVTDRFWAPRIRRNHDVTIPIALQQCYQTGRVDNFLFAARLKPGKFCTQFPFDDTDIYKIIEGASYSLQTFPDEKLSAQLDTLIDYIGKAQEPDGYLYTARTIDPAHPHEWAGAERWVNESKLSHELYNSGHLFEAAVAHFQATGKRTLLDVALKNADLLCRDFGPGRLDHYPGHQIVEMGLVKLYRATGRRAYLDLAKFFLDVRHGGSTYNQSQAPVVEQTEAVGHAVRAAYMYSGMADVAALTGDQAYVHAIDRLWQDVTGGKLYLTGGIGAVGKYEGFGPANQLPNATAYNETCAAIANVYWNHRLFLLHGDARYYDVLECTLYNGLLSGVSLSGDRFFYPNVLASHGEDERSAWFGCACCPSNLCRFLPSMPGYIYATTATRAYVNLYVGSTARLQVGAQQVTLAQESDYPWSGDIDLAVDPAAPAEFELALRIPCWARGEPLPGGLYAFADAATAAPALTLNGQPLPIVLQAGYAVVKRTWHPGDRLHLALPMPVRTVQANELVVDDRDRHALRRGPLVYCAEAIDNPGQSVLDLQLPAGARASSEFRADLLGGVTVVHTMARSGPQADVPLTAVPYFAWANRGKGQMNVWFRTPGAPVAGTQ